MPANSVTALELGFAIVKLESVAHGLCAVPAFNLREVMRLQNKPQMVEAVMFFTDQKISKQMLYPEFEAVLDGMVNMPEFTDQQMQAVYVLINPRLLVRSLVFFYIDFDEKGAADPSWNIPLRHLAERAGRGPDLGAGPIRLACRSQSSVPWHQMHLWDPDLSPKHNHILMVRDAVKSNTLGVLSEDSYEPIIVTEQLTIAAEDRWESASQMDANVAQLEREIYPMSWSGSRADAMAKRLALFTQLFEHPNSEVRDWAIKQHQKLQLAIQVEREREVKENQQRFETFE